MPEMNQQNIGTSLICIHRVITRGLSVSIENSQSFAQTGFPDPLTLSGFSDYVKAWLSVISAHHLVEDELAFPYFRDMIPDAPYDLISAEHQTMASILLEAKVAVGTQPNIALKELEDAATRINKIWHPHIQREEHYFSVARLAELIEPEEHVRLNRLFMEFDQQHSGPDYLVVPFMLYNLSEEDRKVLADAMPPVLTQELVPIVWKDKWSQMKPFLLT